jgi:hypothetical protein
MAYKYRAACDGIDVDVGGRTLHIADPKTKAAAIEAAAAAFAAATVVQPVPPVDYQQKFATLADAVKRIDPNAAKAQLTAAVAAAAAACAEKAAAVEMKADEVQV